MHMARASRQLWEREDEAQTTCFGTVPTPCDRDIDRGTRPGRWLPATHRGRSCRPLRALFLVPNRFCYGLNSPSRARETRVLPRSSATRLHSSDALVILPLPNTANRPLSAPRRLSWPRAAPFWKGYKSLILSTMCISHKHIFVQLSGPDRKIDLEVDDDLCRPHRMLQWVGFGERQLGV